MAIHLPKLFTFLLGLVAMSPALHADEPPTRRAIVIAHRGASGYLPEHTLAAKALAHGMGADYLEQDVVLTKDDVPVVLHDIHLDTVTNVASVFADRAREDGRYYAIDFTLAEIKRLEVHERVDLKSAKPVFPGRFPLQNAGFRIPTLQEEIEFIQGLNKSTGRTAGIYPEIKQPAWHREQGHDISKIVLRVLLDNGYGTKQDKVFLQCFDPIETRRIREELGCELRVVQLIGRDAWKVSATELIQLTTLTGLQAIAEYADGIGPRTGLIVAEKEGLKEIELTNLVEDAHACGLVVHPYTFRKDALPPYADNYETLLHTFVQQAGIDGFFTDFPDLR